MDLLVLSVLIEFTPDNPEARKMIRDTGVRIAKTGVSGSAPLIRASRKHSKRFGSFETCLFKEGCTMEEKDLRAGDVIMSLGDDFDSWLIRLIDGGQYSHASLFDGKELVEAVSDGVKTDSVASLLEDQKLVDVYRFYSDDGEELGSADWPPGPLVTRSHEYLGQRFAYYQLGLLFLLVPIRMVMLPLFLEKFLRTKLEQAVDLLNDLADADRKLMVCSELVYRCFYEADPPKKYGLTIPGVLQARGRRSLAAPVPRSLAGSAEEALILKELESMLPAAEIAELQSVDKDDPDVAEFDRLSRDFMNQYALSVSADGSANEDTVRARLANPNVKANSHR